MNSIIYHSVLSVNISWFKLKHPSIYSSQSKLLITKNQCEYTYLVDNIIHQENGPAIILSIHANKKSEVICEKYFIQGDLHRSDGPAVIMYNYINNKRVIIKALYYTRGKLHRDTGPAVIRYTSYPAKTHRGLEYLCLFNKHHLLHVVYQSASENVCINKKKINSSKLFTNHNGKTSIINSGSSYNMIPEPIIDPDNLFIWYVLIDYKIKIVYEKYYINGILITSDEMKRRIFEKCTRTVHKHRFT